MYLTLIAMAGFAQLPPDKQKSVLDLTTAILDGGTEAEAAGQYCELVKAEGSRDLPTFAEWRQQQQAANGANGATA